MSVYAGPEIINSGLVLAYDMGNTDKSWKGAPATNLTTYSQQINSTNWNIINGTFVPNTIAAPDGTLTASKLAENYTTFSYVYMSMKTSITYSLGTYTTSVYAKAGERPWIYLECANTFAYINLITGAIGSTGSFQTGWTFVSASAVYVGNGWYRTSVTGTCTIAGTYLSSKISPAVGDNGFQYTGVIGYGMYVWGTQVETGTFATPYIPTTTTTASRTNTQAILDPIGKNTITATSLTYASNNTFSFNGVNNYISYSATLSSALTFITIAKSNQSTWNNYAGLGSSRLAGSGLLISNNLGSNSVTGYIVSSNSTPGSPVYIGIATVTPANIMSPHMYAVTTDGISNHAVYYDGSLVGTSTAAVIRTSNTAVVEFGRDYGDTSRYNDVTIYYHVLYNRALSATEIKQQYIALRGRFGI